jgi:isocitrate lyase
MSTREQQIAALEKDWAENPRWKGIKRGYSAADVVRLRGSSRLSTPWPVAAPRSCGIWSTTPPTSTAWAP